MNIVLIGMPGCGKSAVGTHLSQLTGRPFVDADSAFVEKAGMSIPEFFQKFDENAFRKLETEVLQELGKRSGLIIATGGGAILREENVRAMRVVKGFSREEYEKEKFAKASDDIANDFTNIFFILPVLIRM